MSKKTAPLKANIFLLLGEIALRIAKHKQAMKFFKKALQYSWYFNEKELEI